MTRTRVLAGALAAFLAALAAGCGGGGGGGGGGLTKEEYASKLNAICVEFNNKQKEIGNPQTVEEVSTKGEQIITEFDKAIDQAADLDPPDELADAANGFVELGRQQRDLLRQVVEAGKKEDQAKILELSSRIQALDAESDKLAKEIGAPACAG